MKNRWERGLSGVAKEESDDGTGQSNAAQIMTASLLNAWTSSLLNNSGILDPSAEEYGSDEDDILLSLSESLEFYHTQPAYRGHQELETKKPLSSAKEKNKEKKRKNSSKKLADDDDSSLSDDPFTGKVKNEKKHAKRKGRDELKRAKSADCVFDATVVEESKNISKGSLSSDGDDVALKHDIGFHGMEKATHCSSSSHVPLDSTSLRVDETGAPMTHRRPSIKKLKPSVVNATTSRSQSYRDLSNAEQQHSHSKLRSHPRDTNRRVRGEAVVDAMHSSMPNLDFSQYSRELRKEVKQDSFPDKRSATRQSLSSVTETVAPRRERRQSRKSSVDNLQVSGPTTAGKDISADRQIQERDHCGETRVKGEIPRSRRSSFRKSHSVGSVFNNEKPKNLAQKNRHWKNNGRLLSTRRSKISLPGDTKHGPTRQDRTNAQGQEELEKKLRTRLLASGEHAPDKQQVKKRSKLVKAHSTMSLAARVEAFNNSNSNKDLFPNSLPKKHKKGSTESNSDNQREMLLNDKPIRPRQNRGSSVRELLARFEDKTLPLVTRNRSVRSMSQKLDCHAKSWKSDRHLGWTDKSCTKKPADELAKKLAGRLKLANQAGSIIGSQGEKDLLGPTNRSKKERPSARRYNSQKSLQVGDTGSAQKATDIFSRHGVEHLSRSRDSYGVKDAEKSNAWNTEAKATPNNNGDRPELRRAYSTILTEQTRISLEEASVRIKANDTLLLNLDLSSMYLGDPGVGLLTMSLRRNEHLRSLNLANTGLSSSCTMTMVAALLSNKSLEKLYLQDNRLGDNGVEVLARAFLQNKTLKLLNLARNHVGDIGAAALSESLEDNQSFEQLYLYSNQVANIGASALSELLISNRSLTEIYLWDNRIGGTGMASLQSAAALRKTTHPDTRLLLKLK